jgi:uncharacterized damage-inducible protein DinB
MVLGPWGLVYFLKNPMNKNDLEILYIYNYWARHRVLQAAGNLSHETLTVRSSLNFTNLLGTFGHMLNAEWIWRKRCQENVSPRSMELEVGITDFESLIKIWRDEDVLMRSYIEELTDDVLGKVVKYQRISGPVQEDVL